MDELTSPQVSGWAAAVLATGLAPLVMRPRKKVQAAALNTSAFALPALGTYGNLGRNNMKGPGSIQINLAVSRAFVVREGWTFQLRGESFNLPNHLNPAVPVNSMAQSTFGQILSDISGNNGLSPGNQRIIQLAAKFVF